MSLGACKGRNPAQREARVFQCCSSAGNFSSIFPHRCIILILPVVLMDQIVAPLTHMQRGPAHSDHPFAHGSGESAASVAPSSLWGLSAVLRKGTKMCGPGKGRRCARVGLWRNLSPVNPKAIKSSTGSGSVEPSLLCSLPPQGLLLVRERGESLAAQLH